LECGLALQNSFPGLLKKKKMILLFLGLSFGIPIGLGFLFIKF